MKENILLISENTVRTITNISTNINSKFLVSAIKESQLDLELVLGTRLLTKIQSLIENNTIDAETNAPYKELLGKCKYYLAYLTLSNIVMTTTYKIDNFGAVTNTDEHVNSVSMNEAFKLKDFYKNKSEEYLKRLQMFLYKNWNKYTELSKCDVDEFASNTYSASDTSIFLGGERGKGFPNKLRYKYNR